MTTLSTPVEGTTGRADRPLGVDTARAGAPLALPALRETVRVIGIASLSMAVGMAAIAAGAGASGRPLLSFAGRWDDTWFFDIASGGYAHRLPTGPFDVRPLLFAFFPGLPLVLRTFHPAFGGADGVDALIVGFVCLVASCLLLWSLVSTEWGAAIGRRAVLLFAFFPGAFVFALCYSEALAIPLGMASLLSLRRRWYAAAGLFAAFAGTVRLASLALVPACAAVAVVEARRSAGPARVRPFAAPLLAVTGFAGYLVFMAGRTGDAMAFAVAERIGWRDWFSLIAPYDHLRSLVDHPSSTEFWFSTIGIAAVLSAILLLVRVRMPLEHAVYGITVLAIWLFTTNSGTFLRSVELGFPVFVALAVAIPDRVTWVVTGVSAACMAGAVFMMTATLLLVP